MWVGMKGGLGGRGEGESKRSGYRRSIDAVESCRMLVFTLLFTNCVRADVRP